MRAEAGAGGGDQFSSPFNFAASPQFFVLRPFVLSCNLSGFDDDDDDGLIKLVNRGGVGRVGGSRTFPGTSP